MSGKVTNSQLRQLLSDLGFTSRDSVQPRCRVFEHSESGARLVLTSNRDNEPAREADILSLRTHLDFGGHLLQDEFDEFIKHGVLKAS